jgi:pyruvate formate lyase activating enzyme
VFDIKRGSLDDGDGIRTVVFIKGCPLRCDWCHNPESWLPDVEFSFDPSSCGRCLRCVRCCPRHAIHIETSARPRRALDAGQCVWCGACAEQCVTRALRRIGTAYPDETLLGIIMEDEPYYRVSGGGLTFSGGEPLFYPRYTGRIAQKLWEQDIPVLIETCGYFDYAEFERSVLPYITEIYFDLKLMDPGAHKRHTGKDNTLILENFRRLSGSGVTLTPRTPLIPGITDTRPNLRAIREFLKLYNLETRYVTLPYNVPAADEIPIM